MDVERSSYNLGVGEGLPQRELEERQEKVDKVVENVNEMTRAYQQAKTHRLELEQIVGQAGTKIVAAQKDLADHQADLDRLEKAKQDRQLTKTKEILDLPIINAFNSPLKIEQIWLPKLTLNNNFSDVARFDRCITCHQAIDKSGAGSATAPAYPPRPHELVPLSLKSPAEPPAELKDTSGADEKGRREALSKIYGLELADEGLLDSRDVVISVVRPLSPARGCPVSGRRRRAIRQRRRRIARARAGLPLPARQRELGAAGHGARRIAACRIRSARTRGWICSSVRSARTR